MQERLGWLAVAAVAAWVLLCGPAAAHEAEEGEAAPVMRAWGMPYPPAELPQADDIFHVGTGVQLSFEGLMDILSGMRIVYVGETHDNIHAHRVELAVIRELARRFPGKVAVGMEMFREPQQPALDRWTRGELTEIEFLKLSGWYDTWGSDYGYYREILDFARQSGIDVVALNPPKKLQEEVSKAGLDKLPEELRAQLPEMGPPDPYQRESLKAVFGAHKATEGMVDSFLRIQALWEETMATRIVSYLESGRGEGKRMVVLSGGWHVRYGFGIPKKVLRRLPLPSAILSPEELSIPEEKKDQMMDVDLPEIPLLAADFFWMVPYEGLEKNRVLLGVRLSMKDGRVMIDAVDEDFPAAKVGIPAGSEILSLDGQPVADITDVQVRIRAKRPGDQVTVVARSEGVERTFVFYLFRVTPKEHGEKK